MPWLVRKTAKGASIVKKDTGKVAGHSSSVKKAKASVRARYAAIKGERKK